MTKRVDIAPGEFRVLNALWKVREGSVADVLAELSRAKGKAPAYTTVMTVLGRLAAKGVIEVDRAREPFLYKPLMRRSPALADRIRSFLDVVFDGSSDALVLHLIENDMLDENALRRVEAALKRKPRQGAKK